MKNFKEQETNKTAQKEENPNKKEVTLATVRKEPEHGGKKNKMKIQIESENGVKKGHSEEI